MAISFLDLKYGKLAAQTWLNDTDKISIACWVNFATIISPATTQYVFHLAGVDGQISLRKDINTYLRWSVTVPGGVFATCDSTTAPVAGTTYRVLASWTKNTASTGIRIWVNGTNERSNSTTTQTVNYNAGSSDLYLGVKSGIINKLQGALEGLLIVKGHLWTDDDVAELSWSGWPWQHAWAGNEHLFLPLWEQQTTRIPDWSGAGRNIESAGIVGPLSAGGEIGRWDCPWALSASGSSMLLAGAATPPDEGWTECGTVAHPLVSLVVSGLTDDTTYQFRARAQDEAGNLSTYSTIAEATPRSHSKHNPREVFLYHLPDEKPEQQITATLKQLVASAWPASVPQPKPLEASGFEIGDADNNFLEMDVARFLDNAEIRNDVTGSGSTYTARCYPTGSTEGCVEFQDMADGGDYWDEPTVYSKMDLLPTTVPTSGHDSILGWYDQSGYIKGELHINSNRKLELYDSTGALLGTGTTTLWNLLGVSWYRIETMIGTGASSAFEVRINGDTEMSGTGNFRTSNHSSAFIGRSRYGLFGDAVDSDCGYDDVSFDGGWWVGATKVVKLVVGGDGYYAQWTARGGPASKYLCVDEDLPNGNTDYIDSTTSASKYSATVGALGVSAKWYRLVKACATYRKNDSSSLTKCATILRSSTTDVTSTLWSLSQTYYSTYPVSRSKDPATSTWWTESGINAAQVGVLHSSTSGDVRCTQMCLMVEYELSA
jgi:hypothetical protein